MPLAPESLRPAMPAEPPRAWRLACLGLIYVLAAGLLLWRFLSSDLHYDGALIGLMVQSFLRGDFHVFFFGNNYMGTLDAVLAMPVLALFGSSTLAVNFWPPVLCLATTVMLHRIMDRWFGFWGVVAGLAYLALPPAFSLFFAGEARTHYGLGLFLSALLMWQTVRLWEAEAWRPRPVFAWGLVAGLAFWTNFLSATAILPCALFLLATRRQRLSPRLLAWALLGGLLGAAPLIYYNATNGWPHLGLTGDLRLGPELNAASPYSLGHAIAYIGAVAVKGLPVMLGLWSPHLGAIPLDKPVFAAYLAVLALLAAGLMGLAWRGRRTQERPVLLPVAMLLLSLVVVVASHYGSQISQSRPRYLLWLYLPLPFCWAWLAQALAGRARPLAPALALGLCLVNLAGYPGFLTLWGQPLLLTRGGFFFQQERAYRDFLAQTRQAGVHHLYADETRGFFYQPNRDEGAYELAFLSPDDMEVADFSGDKRPRASALVDAAFNPGFYTPGLAPKVAFLGLEHQSLEGRVFHGFQEPAQVERLLEPAGLKADTLAGHSLGQVLTDGNFRTGFVTQGPAKNGDGFVLDLGRPHMVAGLAMVPTVHWEVPRGLRIEGAGPDGQFRVLRETPVYRAPLFVSGPRPFLKTRYGRVESYFPAQELRYLRVTHLGPSGHHWSVQQILLFGPDDQAPDPPSWEQSLEMALAEVERAGLKRLYADAWPSARAWLRLEGRVWTLPANRAVNVYGGTDPPDTRPVFLDCRSGSGLLVHRRAAGRVGRVLDTAGVGFTSRTLGRFELFLLQGRSTGASLEIRAVSSPVDPQAAAELAAGRPRQGRWASQGPQVQGLGLTLDLGQPREVAWLTLANPSHPHDFPRRLKALASDDGQSWRPVEMVLAGPLVFTGEVLLTYPGGESLYRFSPPVKARHLRLELADGDPQWWWSVEGLRLAGPAPMAGPLLGRAD